MKKTLLKLLPEVGKSESGGIQPLSDVNMDEHTDSSRLALSDGSMIREPSSCLRGPTGDLLENLQFYR